MMMPANFSAIAENEMTYVVGGGLEDYLAPVMTASNWQTFSTNLVTIIGNTYMSNFVKSTLGTIFTGTYVPGNVTKGIAASLSNVWNSNVNPSVGMDQAFGVPTAGSYVVAALNVGLQIVGGMAAVYTMGQASVKAYQNGSKLDING